MSSARTRPHLPNLSGKSNSAEGERFSSDLVLAGEGLDGADVASGTLSPTVGVASPSADGEMDDGSGKSFSFCSAIGDGEGDGVGVGVFVGIGVAAGVGAIPPEDLEAACVAPAELPPPVTSSNKRHSPLTFMRSNCRLS